MRLIPMTELGSKSNYCTFLAYSNECPQTDDEVAKTGVCDDRRYLEYLMNLIFDTGIYCQ